MHVVIINGSPRVEKNSNTDKIIDAIGEGLTQCGVTYEKHAVSRRGSWEEIREAYMLNEEILIALPLYVECAPGILLEFLETLPTKDENTRMSFVLQSGFAEASQLRCGEKFLENLPGYLGIRYGGTLIKGDNFGIRVVNAEERRQITDPYVAMGRLFAEGDGFLREEAADFAGPEYFSLPMRLMLQIMFKTIAKKRYAEVARDWGCTTPLDARPWT